MNYPFRNAILDLLRTRDTAFFVSVLTELYASYPREVCDSLMNLLGTHDTVRILTALGDDDSHEEEPNAALAKRRLSPDDRETAIRLLLIASTLQFTVFGFPSVYYGDEAGMEGYRDPFCRLPFPWGRENQTLLNHYRRLGALRKKHPALRDGDFRFLEVRPAAFLLERKKGTDRVLVAVNLQDTPASFALSSPRRMLTVKQISAAVVE